MRDERRKTRALTGQEHPSSDDLRASLLVYHHAGAQMLPLIAGEPVVVGRSAPATLVIADPGLSREHARFELLDGEIWVEDLQSTNHTWVNDKMITRGYVPEGASIRMGDVVAFVHHVRAQDSPLHRLLQHDQFLRALQEEINRGRAFGQPVTVLMLKAAQEGVAYAHPWLQRIRKLLRPQDAFSLYSTNTVEVMMPALSSEQAQAQAALLLKDEKLFCGLATFPEAGTSAESLLAASKQALDEASVEVPLQVVKAEVQSWVALPEEADKTHVIPVAQSPRMRAVQEMASRVAQAEIPVLIYGETGAGKEVVARAIHQLGSRRDHRMCSVNCGAIPESLVESVLFGHVRGAFTSADKDATGVFEAANKGTVFLDEIAELPLTAQAALLRVLETKQVMRVGSTHERRVDVRILASTHRNLEALCQTGGFRRDLLYRLNTIIIQVPPLRERLEDIAALIEYFIRQVKVSGDRRAYRVNSDAMTLLCEYSWPGNARELRNVIERAAVIAHGPEITPSDLPQAIRERATLGRHLGASDDGDEFSPDTISTTFVSGPPTQEIQRGSFRDRVGAFETQLIRAALERCHWNQTAAARELDMPLRTLVRKVKAYRIYPPRGVTSSV